MPKANAKLVERILDDADDRRAHLGLQEVIEVEKVNHNVYSFLDVVEKQGASHAIIDLG